MIAFFEKYLISDESHGKRIASSNSEWEAKNGSKKEGSAHDLCRSQETHRTREIAFTEGGSHRDVHHG
jgi:hypothetical protein